MASVTITWHIKDNNACPICKQMAGYTWTFEVGEHKLNGILEHPASPTGIAWTMTEGSRAHGDGGGCRCSIDYDLDVHDILVRLQKVYDDLLWRNKQTQIDTSLTQTGNIETGGES